MGNTLWKSNMAGHVSIFQREKHLSMDTLIRILQLPKGTADQDRGLNQNMVIQPAFCWILVQQNTHYQTLDPVDISKFVFFCYGITQNHNLKGKAAIFGSQVVSGVDYSDFNKPYILYEFDHELTWCSVERWVGMIPRYFRNLGQTWRIILSGWLVTIVRTFLRTG